VPKLSPDAESASPDKATPVERGGGTAVNFGANNRFGNVTLEGQFAGGDIVTINVAEQDYDVSGLQNPYIGLESFTYETRARFGGRERQVAEAAQVLTTPGHEHVALFVTGASGSGKSSFVQAGLIPALEEQYLALGKTVRRAVLRPGRSPNAAMHQALLELGLPDSFAATGATDDGDQLGGFLAAHSPPAQLNLLVLDQFEELFTQSDAAERATFCRLLTALGTFAEVRSHVIATVRADYLPSMFEQPRLFELVKQQGIELRGMSSSELARAIRRPLEYQNSFSRTTKRWQQELVDRLVEDTLAESTLLPLLQVTLESIWRRGKLTLDRYGTLTDALEEDADTAYLYHPGPPQTPRAPAEQQLVMSIFLDLVEVSLDDDPRRDVRRSLPKGDLVRDQPARGSLIDELVAARLLSVERRGEQQVDTVDIIHETLLRNWARLAVAIKERRDALQQRERFRGAAAEWLEHERADAYTLDGVRLAEARALAASGDVALRDPAGHALLARSVALAERQRRRSLAIVAGVLTVVFVAILVSLYLYLDAQRAREQTITQEARELASNAVAQLDVDPERSLLLSKLAVDRAPSGADAREADAALRLSLLLSHVRATETVHQRVVNSGVFSPDGSRILTASADGILALWTPGDTVHPLVVATDIGDVGGAIFTTDGSRIAAFGSTGAMVWNFVGGVPSGALKLASGGTNGLAFTPDGQSLVTAGDDRMARVWDASNGQQRAVLRTSGRVLDVAVSADGQRVATAASDGQVRVWSWWSNAPPLELHPAQGVNRVTFTPDGSRLLTAGRDGTAGLWDVQTGMALATWSHERAVTSGAFNRDGTRAVTASEDGTAHIWDVATGALLRTLLGHAGIVVSATFDGDGGRVVTASTDGSARIWDVRSGLDLAVLSGHAGGLTGAVFSPDGLQVVTSSWDSTARVWDASVGKQPPVVRAPSGGLTDAAFSPDGHWLLTVGTDPVARVWDAYTGALQMELATGALTAGRFSPDGNRIGVGGSDGRASLWDWRAGQKLAELLPDSSSLGALNAVAFSPDGERLAVAGTAGGGVWTWASGGAMILGSGCPDPTCRHTDAVTSVAFSTDGARLVTSSNDTTARIWRADDGVPLGGPLKHANQLHDAIFWGPDHVITASADRTAHVWNLTTRREEAGFFGHAGIVDSVELSTDGRWLVTASDDSTARVWDLATRETIAILSGHVGPLASASFSADAMPRVVTTGDDGAARIALCEVCADLPTLRALAETRVTRVLTTDERRRYLRQEMLTAMP
jgi:WD40 repeat protein